MKYSVIEWATIHLHGDLWWQHLMLRKALFVDEMGWTLPHTKDVEWDQYDTPNTKYIVTHSKGRAVAASRLNPCSVRSGDWTYMIQDAHRGLLNGIPANVITCDPPSSDTVWEATRFTVDPSLSATERQNALSDNARQLSDTAREAGATHLIALMPPAYIRWLSGLGFTTRRIGPTLKDEHGARFCAMEMEIGSVSV